MLQKVYPGWWFQKQEPEEEVAEHAAAMTQNLNLGPRQHITASTPINTHVVNEQSLTSLVSFQVWKPSKRGRQKSRVCVANEGLTLSHHGRFWYLTKAWKDQGSQHDTQLWSSQVHLLQTSVHTREISWRNAPTFLPATYLDNLSAPHFISTSIKKALPKLCATANDETPPEQQKILKFRAQESNQHEGSHAHMQKMGSSDFKSNSI